jgi:hypothetical protein
MVNCCVTGLLGDGKTTVIELQDWALGADRLESESKTLVAGLSGDG